MANDDVVSGTSSEDSASLPELYNPAKKMAPTEETTKPKVKPPHPSTADMVTEAIVQLADRNGSSLPAIKKYITKTYKLDVDKQAIYIKRYLKSAVANGSLIQTKGKGASGSFKIPSAKQKAAMAKAALEENPSLAAKPISPKKAESAKAPAVSKRQAKKAAKKESNAGKKTKVTKAIAMATPPKSPSRTKKIAKSPTSKPKAPKPKKVNATVPPKSESTRKMTTVKK